MEEDSEFLNDIVTPESDAKQKLRQDIIGAYQRMAKRAGWRKEADPNGRSTEALLDKYSPSTSQNVTTKGQQ